MPYTVTYNPELQVIETKAYEVLDFSEAKEIISGIIEIGLAQKCFLCLSDYREATIRLSTMEIYEIPKIIAAIATARGLFPGSFKRALIIGRDYSDFEFLEAVTLNNMQNAKLFREFEDAKKWLLNK